MAVLLLACGAVGYKGVSHLLAYRRNVIELQRSVKELSVRIGILELKQRGGDLKAAKFVSDCKTNGGYKYLAIGNSITRHGICEYWWNECGMAASDEMKDYFALVVNDLKSKHLSVNAIAYNASSWEVLSHDRSQPAELIENFLCEDLDLVTIQLGENVVPESDGTYGTLENDFIYLINKIKRKAPKAKILVIGDFWGANKLRDKIKKSAAEKCNVTYISLEVIADKPEFESSIGAKVYSIDNIEHTVNHSGVASHPGDKGMLYVNFLNFSD